MDGILCGGDTILPGLPDQEVQRTPNSPGSGVGSDPWFLGWVGTVTVVRPSSGCSLSLEGRN